MEFRVSFRNMDSSNALRAYAQEKLEDKIKRYVTKPIEANVTFALDGLNHVVHLNVIAGDGFDVHLQEKASLMYVALDTLADTLDASLKRQKEKLKDHHAKKGGLKTFARTLDQNVGDALDDMPIDASEIVAEASRLQVARG